MTDSPSLDQRYFEWLYQRVASLKDRNLSRSYFKLCEQLYMTPFEVRVPNDDNRAEDARELRWDFLGYEDLPDELSHWAMMDASIFEVLIALSERVSFESEESPLHWFWHILDNLGLTMYNDATYKHGSANGAVSRILERVNHRTYSPSGQGGMFPLSHAREDQRHVELWYQMSAYLLEKFV